jgi:hypothetical protein
MKRLSFTQHTVRCPLEDRTASLTVRTDPGGCPSRRHLDVNRARYCRRRPSSRRQGTAISRMWRRPCRASARWMRPAPVVEVACPRPCLAVLECRRSRRRGACTLHLGGQ